MSLAPAQRTCLVFIHAGIKLGDGTRANQWRSEFANATPVDSPYRSRRGAERDKILGDLEKAGQVQRVDWEDGFHHELAGRNGGGDPWRTDGRLVVVTLVPGEEKR